MVELSPEKRIASIQLYNDSAVAMVFQTEALSWQQTGGEDSYGQTQDLLVAPAIARIAPGATQIFRVTLRRAATVEVERAYRLLFEDITEVQSPQARTVTFRFRHNLPLFATPRQPAVVNSQWLRCTAPAGRACVRLQNQGNRRVRLSGVAVEGQGWRKEIKGGTTVLAGASRQWLFDLKADQPTALRVIPTSGIGEVLPAVDLPGLVP